MTKDFLLPIITSFSVLTSSQNPKLVLEDSTEKAVNTFKVQIEKPCYKAVVENLSYMCLSMSSEEHTRIALGFANCFLRQSGKETYDCIDVPVIEECTSKLSSEAFETYTTFYVQTEMLCYYYQNDLWARQAEILISNLTSTSKEMSKIAIESLEKTKEYIEVQEVINKNFVISNQVNSKTLQELERTTSILDALHDKTLEGFKNVSKEVEQNGQIFKFILENIVDTVRTLSWPSLYVDTSLFYVLYFACSYLLTLHTRLADKRFLLYFVMLINWIVERIITTLLKSYGPTLRDKLKDILLAERFLFIGFSVFVLWSSYKKFEDTNRLILDRLKIVESMSRGSQNTSQRGMRATYRARSPLYKLIQ